MTVRRRHLCSFLITLSILANQRLAHASALANNSKVCNVSSLSSGSTCQSAMCMLLNVQAGFKYVRSWSNNLTSLPSLALRGFHRSLVGRLTLRNRRKLGVPLMSSGGAGGAEEKLGVFFRKESDRQALVDRLHESDRLILNTDAGPEEATSARGFDVNKFFSHLSTRQLGNTVIYNHSLASTQELMMSTLKSEAEGVVCVSDIQTSGRGRGTNSWTSPEGCLCFSFSTGVEEAKLLPFFQYVVSIAMYQAISEIGGADAKSLGVQLKWPNDIYGSRSQKIGGVLCQSTVSSPQHKQASGHTYRIVAGVGINTLNSQPTTCVRDLIRDSSNKANAEKVSRELLLATFCNHFETLLDDFSVNGFKNLRDLYLHAWIHSGQKVQVQVEDKSETPITVEIVGISPSGFLSAVDDKGKVIELHPDGNSLDMLQGLIYMKRG